MLVLQWESQPRPYTLNWVGPNLTLTAISTIEEIENKIAVITGPRGEKGDKGDPGQVGGLPTSLDGGNF